MEPSYPDRAWSGKVELKANTQIARGTYRLRIECPEIASRIVPGQFVMIRLADRPDPLLGRPLALYDVVSNSQGEPRGIEIVYLAVGKMTRQLAHSQPGTPLEVWGPLGNGFPPHLGEHVVMVAGGIGQTPFPALAKEALGLQQFGTPPRAARQARKVTLCWGVRSAEYLADLPKFEQLGVEVRVATEDGSAGHRGLVTELIEPVIEESAGVGECRMVCCGPEPMLAAAVQIARKLDVGCLVSLETPMACGMGICFSCVTAVRTGHGTWDYRRVCVDGPVFDAKDVMLEQ